VNRKASRQHRHLDHDHIAAVFPDRASAELAVAELRRRGLGSEHLGVAIHNGDAVAFEHDSGVEMMHDAEIGVAAGAPLGALAGLALVALSATGIGAVSVGGILALASASGMLGGVLGGYLGIATGSGDWDADQEAHYAHLQPGEVLVVACGHDRVDEVTTTLLDSGGRLVENRAEPGGSA
jgi:hypothetical protein